MIRYSIKTINFGTQNIIDINVKLEAVRLRIELHQRSIFDSSLVSLSEIGMDQLNTTIWHLNTNTRQQENSFFFSPTEWQMKIYFLVQKKTSSSAD